MKKTAVALAAVLGFAAAPALALDFNQVDIDANGGVSIEEARTFFPTLNDAEFATFDTSGTGELSQPEFVLLVDRIDDLQLTR